VRHKIDIVELHESATVLSILRLRRLTELNRTVENITVRKV
jgi:hypothetical protein